jgi:hypothetical protein
MTARVKTDDESCPSYNFLELGLARSVQFRPGRLRSLDQLMITSRSLLSATVMHFNSPIRVYQVSTPTKKLFLAAFTDFVTTRQTFQLTSLAFFCAPFLRQRRCALTAEVFALMQFLPSSCTMRHRQVAVSSH